MAKQPFANMPTPGPVGRFNLKQNFFVFLIGLAILSLLAGIFSQMITVKAQTAEQQTLTFSDQTVGTQSANQTATFDNNSGFDMNVAVSVTGDYVLVNNGCGFLAASEGTTSCNVEVAFKPTAPGLRTGAVNFNYSYENGVTTVSPSPATTGFATTEPPPTEIPTTTAPSPSPSVGLSPSPSIGLSPSVPGYGKGSNSGFSINQARPNAIVSGSSSVTLTGTGIAQPTTATTKAPNNCASGIQGYVLIDGQAGSGVKVNLTGPTNSSVTVGDGGYFYFNDLCKGDYQIALDYDHTKYSANDADTRQITLDGVSGSRNNAFSLSTGTTSTTAAPTTEAPTTAPSGTTTAPTTPAVTTAPAQVPSCNIPGGTVLRVCTATTQQSATHFALVIGVQAGDSPVNLNDTVIVNLPVGVVVNSATSAIGVVTTTSSNTIRWGSFSLNPKQSATLVLSIDAPAGNLSGSSLFVSGSFNRSQAFQQRIAGLPGLTDIFPAAVATQGTGGQGGGVSVPSQAPSTGVGQTSGQDAPVALLITLAILLGGIGILGLFLTNRPAKRSNKEQK